MKEKERRKREKEDKEEEKRETIQNWKEGITEKVRNRRKVKRI